MWKLDNGLELIRRLEPLAMSENLHLGLTGSFS